MSLFFILLNFSFLLIRYCVSENCLLVNLTLRFRVFQNETSIKNIHLEKKASNFVDLTKCALYLCGINNPRKIAKNQIRDPKNSRCCSFVWVFL